MTRKRPSPVPTSGTSKDVIILLCRREPRRPNRSWRVDETYVKVAGNWTYLYRAVDSTGETIEFMLSRKRDLAAAKLFLRLALSGGGPPPPVINVDGHPAYASAIDELKASSELGRRCRCRNSPYMNNIIGQDHRFIKKRITASLGFRSGKGACRTMEGYEALHAIGKGRSDGSPRAILSVSVNSSTRSSASPVTIALYQQVDSPLPFALRVCNTTRITV